MWAVQGPLPHRLCRGEVSGCSHSIHRGLEIVTAAIQGNRANPKPERPLWCSGDTYNSGVRDTGPITVPPSLAVSPLARPFDYLLFL